MRQYARTFRRQLDSGGLTPDNVQVLAELATDWFTAEPEPAVLLVRGILLELSGRWDNAQAIHEADYQFIMQTLLPALKSLPADVSPDLGGVHSLAVAWHQCLQGP